MHEHPLERMQNYSKLNIPWTQRSPIAAKVLEAEALFDKIKEHFHKFYQGDIELLKTEGGATQAAAADAEGIVASMLSDMGLSSERAKSQDSKDFRNVGNTGLDIEVKKTDSNVTIMNDTCPDETIHYIIFCTAARIKKKTATVLFMNGEELINAPCEQKLQESLQRIAESEARHKAVIKAEKENLGNLELYIRTRHSVKIGEFY